MTGRTRPILVVGGGWAGLSAAVHTAALGHPVTVLEASRQWGGRARSWPLQPAPEAMATLDNGQHILIGAYRTTLALMKRVGVPLTAALQVQPLSLPRPDGQGLVMPSWARACPPPWNLLAALLSVPGWTWRDRLALLRTTARWRMQGFTCAPEWTVAQLCGNLPPRVIADLVDPLCVAALNTPIQQASAQVFLRVLHDALLGPGHAPYRASDLLLPRQPLEILLPEPARRWLTRHGATMHDGQRVQSLQATDAGWQVHTSEGVWQAEQVVLACSAREAARLVHTLPDAHPGRSWAALAHALPHEAIATVYMQASSVAWPHEAAMLSLPDGPAQFVFHHGKLGGPAGLLAWVASACHGPAAEVEAQVRQQAQRHLGLANPSWVQTVVEKRATFACTPGLQRPGAVIAPGLWAAGDYIDGPYPATLEGATRSGQAVAHAMQRFRPPPSGPDKPAGPRNA